MTTVLPFQSRENYTEMCTTTTTHTHTHTHTHICTHAHGGERDLSVWPTSLALQEHWQWVM